MIIYILLGLVLLTITVFIGIKMSEGITHPSLLIFYWVVYIATILTIANAVSTVFFYGVLRSKRGIPGDQGRVGDKGDTGLPGVCDTGCSTKACNVSILKNINNTYASLLRDYKIIKDTNTPTIKNREIIDNIKLICNSDPYKQVTSIKPGNMVNNYISDIYSKWLKVLFESDTSNNKKTIISYLETDGLEDKPDLPGNPFAEIEKYDIYYWGRERVFSPRIIEYCNNGDVNKLAPTKYTPLVKGIRTNMHTLLRNHDHFKMRKSKWKIGYYYTYKYSLFRTNPYTYDGAVYYPLGDWWVNDRYRNNLNTTNKFIETIGTEKTKRINFGSNSLFTGPNNSTLLLAADDKYLMAPLEWTKVWHSTAVNSNWATSVWVPRDYYNKKLGKWFRGCGFYVNTRDRSTSPRHLAGFNTPERQQFRLVNEDLLITRTSSDLTYLWDAKNSGVSEQLSFWLPNDPEYRTSINLPVIARSWSHPGSLKYYILNLEKFKERSVGEATFKHELVDRNQYGIGYFGLPSREEKYSIFPFLNIPMEVQLINTGNGDKLFVKHSGLNTINSYIVRRLNIGDQDLTTSFGVSSNPSVTSVNTKLSINTGNPNQIWKIECIDNNNNISTDCRSFRYLIKASERENLYLSSLMKESTTDDFIYTVKPLPAKTSENYDIKMAQFIWFKPLSATGNQLIMEIPSPSSTPTSTPTQRPSATSTPTSSSR
jgi:hypothetical protein